MTISVLYAFPQGSTFCLRVRVYYQKKDIGILGRFRASDSIGWVCLIFPFLLPYYILQNNSPAARWPRFPALRPPRPVSLPPPMWQKTERTPAPAPHRLALRPPSPINQLGNVSHPTRQPDHYPPLPSAACNWLASAV